MWQEPQPPLHWALPPTLGTSLGLWQDQHHLGQQGERAGQFQGRWQTTGASQAEGFWLQKVLTGMGKA